MLAPGNRQGGPGLLRGPAVTASYDLGIHFTLPNVFVFF